MQPHPLAGPAGLPARALALSLVLALSGCAGFSPDTGMDTVAALARERTGHAPRLVRDDAAQALVRVRVDELLAAPLGAEAAVELALLASPALQASLRELGIAEADLVAAGRLRNPVFGFLDVARGASYKIERSLGFDVLVVRDLARRKPVEQACAFVGARFEHEPRVELGRDQIRSVAVHARTGARVAAEAGRGG